MPKPTRRSPDLCLAFSKKFRGGACDSSLSTRWKLLVHGWCHEISITFSHCWNKHPRKHLKRYMNRPKRSTDDQVFQVLGYRCFREFLRPFVSQKELLKLPTGFCFGWNLMNPDYAWKSYKNTIGTGWVQATGWVVASLFAQFVQSPLPGRGTCREPDRPGVLPTQPTEHVCLFQWTVWFHRLRMFVMFVEDSRWKPSSEQAGTYSLRTMKWPNKSCLQKMASWPPPGCHAPRSLDSTGTPETRGWLARNMWKHVVMDVVLYILWPVKMMAVGCLVFLLFIFLLVASDYWIHLILKDLRVFRDISGIGWDSPTDKKMTQHLQPLNDWSFVIGLLACSIVLTPTIRTILKLLKRNMFYFKVPVSSERNLNKWGTSFLHLRYGLSLN